MCGVAARERCSLVQCRLCKRRIEAVGGAEQLCRYHLEATVELRKGYEVWKSAYSDISWRDYLKRTKALEDTGQWIKDVISLEEERIH